MALLSEFTSLQQAVLVVVCKIAAFLSFMGSTAIIGKILSSREKCSNMKDRLLLRMSCFDIIYSIANFVGTWAFPSSTQVWGAKGTNASCAAQGFVIHLGYAVLWYNLTLAVYFLLVVKYRAWHARLARAETFIHVAIVGYSLAGALANVLFDAVKPKGLICMVYEPKLEEAGGAPKPTVLLLGALTAAIPSFTTLAVGAVSMVLLYMHVRSTEQRMDRYAAQVRSNTSRLIAIQGALYMLGLVLSWGPSLIHNIVLWVGNGKASFWWQVLSAGLNPLQGVFNVAVYWQSLNQSTNQRLRRQNSKSDLSIGTFALEIAKVVEGPSSSTKPETLRSNSCPILQLPHSDGDWDIEGALLEHQKWSNRTLSTRKVDAEFIGDEEVPSLSVPQDQSPLSDSFQMTDLGEHMDFEHPSSLSF